MSREAYFRTGLGYIGRDVAFTTTNKRRFGTSFGTTPFICELIWKGLELKVPIGTMYYHLLWALLFLKLYSPEAVLSGMIGVDEKTLRKHVWNILRSMNNLKRKYIRLRDRFQRSNGSACLMSVDGADFKIFNPPFNRMWFSHKFNHAALRYELAICIQTGLLVWTKGPFPPGDWPDINIFRGWLKGKLLPLERIEADYGYQGDAKADGPDDHCSTLAQEELKFTIRGRHETVNARMKIFGALSQVYRHKREDHHLIFNSVALITQLVLQYENPLFPEVYTTEQ